MKNRIARFPTFKSYGKYSSSNYGVHTLCFEDPLGNKFWYSHKALVAFQAAGTSKKIVCQNNGNPLAEKHLTWIDGGNKKDRVTESQFRLAFQSTFNQELAV